MNVLTLVPSEQGYSPGQRSSIELWEQALAAAGIRLHYAPFETSRLRQILHQPGKTAAKAWEMLRAYEGRLRLLDELDRFDAVFVYREAALLGPAFLEKRIARRKPIIYQLDDPLFVPYRSPSNGLFSYLKCFSKVAEICRLSKVVIVNSPQIREYAEQYNGNLWQVPCLVDAEQYVFDSAQPESDNDKVCLGWSGSPSTVGNLRIVAPALRALAEEAPHRVHLIGNAQFDLPGVNFTAQAWCAETEINDLRRLQIGLAPVPVNEWNKRKFYMKTAQYMALGIVPVCTPLGANTQVIRHGENGFLADSTVEWVECLRLLINDHDLRRKLSYQAARDAHDKYTLQANQEKIVAAFRAALN
ncbi:MAG: glycosyltransferase [Acidobacteriota bacterium]